MRVHYLGPVIQKEQPFKEQWKREMTESIWQEYLKIPPLTSSSTQQQSLVVFLSLLVIKTGFASAATTYKFCTTHHILTKHLNIQFKRLQITNPYTFGNETLHKNTWSFHQCSQVHPQAQPNQITQQKSLSLLLKIKGYHNKKLHHYSLAIVTPSFTILG